MPTFRFHKSEKLCSSILIAKLFEKGNRSINRFPFRFSWHLINHSGDYPAQVLFVVSRKNFPRAHDRNKLKRKMRELYRIHKHLLYQKLGDQKLILQIGFTAKSHNHHTDMQAAFVQAFNEMLKYV
jgi:ribonuclease P protein component